MALAYVLLALVIIALNIGNLPQAFAEIIGGAFGLQQMAGGFTGGIAAAMLNGLKRGLFSNEAGMGSAPNVAATATVSHPVKQGLIQSLGVFVDTMIICTATALIILVSGPGIYDPHAPGKMAGASLTASAVAASLGPWTTWLMTILVFVFAFSSVLGNYVYAEINLFFLGVKDRGITIFRLLVLAAIGLGGLAKLSTVWDIADISMGFMAIVNLIAIVLLGKWAFALLRNYHLQAEAGDDPVFVAEEASLPGPLEGDIWTRSRSSLLR
jgi:AGCS family alanine or glycine:cation symporter